MLFIQLAFTLNGDGEFESSFSFIELDKHPATATYILYTRKHARTPMHFTQCQEYTHTYKHLWSVLFCSFSAHSILHHLLLLDSMHTKPLSLFTLFPIIFYEKIELQCTFKNVWKFFRTIPSDSDCKMLFRLPIASTSIQWFSHRSFEFYSQFMFNREIFYSKKKKNNLV